MASVQVFAEAEFVPELREQLTHTYQQGAQAIAAMLIDIDIEAVDEAGRRVGLLALGIINGTMLHWLIAPGAMPTARELAAALRSLVQA